MTVFANQLNFYGISSDQSGKVINPKTINEALKSYTDLDGTRIVGYSYTPTQMATHDDLKPLEAVDIARAIFAKECFLGTSTRNDEDKKRCFNESLSKISYKPGLRERWMSAIDNLDVDAYAAGVKEIEKEICSGNPVPLRVARLDKYGKFKQHTILATKTVYNSQGQLDFGVYNPGTDDGDTSISFSDLKKYPYLVGFDVFRPAADPSMLAITSSPNVDFVITDSKGRRAGFDSFKNIKYDEIPGAKYITENKSVNADSLDFVSDEFPLDRKELIFEADPNDKVFPITVYGNENGSAILNISKTDSSGTINDNEGYNVNITRGIASTFNINHTSASLPTRDSVLQIRSAFYNFAGWLKNILRSKASNLDSVNIVGQITLPNKIKIGDGDLISLNIGSLTDFTQQFSLQSFIKRRDGQTFLYEFDHTKYNILIADDGRFWIELRNIDLQLINNEKWGKITLKVNNHAGFAQIDLNCKVNTCYGETK